MDVVINVAGNKVLDKTRSWDMKFQQEVFASRINTTHLLANAIQSVARPPKSFVTISGVGYYPYHESKEYDEYSKVTSNDFFHKLVVEWEAAAALPASLPTRQVAIRSGVVLGRSGGMIQEIWWPFYLGAGGRMGSGKQWMPFIHIDDLVRLFLFAVEEDHVRGVLNGVAPHPATNEQFAKAFAAALWRPCLFPVPEAVFKMMFGDERAEMITRGQKVLPKRTLELGFTFEHSTVEQACKALA